jgi:hypothetical protein
MRRTPSRRRLRAFGKTAEIAIAAPQVMALRTARMLAAGAHPNRADRAELLRMSTEKLQAFSESVSAIAAHTYKTNQELALLAMREWWTTWLNPWYRVTPPRIAPFGWPPLLIFAAASNRLQSSMLNAIEKGLTPVHKRATRNARRLTRAKKRAARSKR